MWVRVDENFPEHPKVLKAGELLGENGCGRAAAVWLEALCYANKHLTDGFISKAVARRFRLDTNPLQVIRIFSRKSVALFESKIGGWKIHDYHNYQFAKAEIEETRQKARDRMRRVRANNSRTEKVFALPDPDRTGTPDQDQKEQSASRTTHTNDDDNPRVLLKLAHTVFDDFTAGRLTTDDFTEELKCRAAHAHLRYDGDRIRKALESAERQRREGPTH